MRVLVACEESQAVCKAFRERGHEAYSADIQECSGGHPEWHICGDCIPYLNGNCNFITQGGQWVHIEGRWDLIIAHPPCTYLTVTGNRYFNTETYGKKAEKRWKDRVEAAVFFMRFVAADCDRIAIENPVGVMGSAYRTADQLIQPCMFGDPFEKLTCLWLKNLPKLKATNPVEPPPRQVLPSGKTIPAWYSKGNNRAKLRSKTFPGIANAMADQWGGLVR